MIQLLKSLLTRQNKRSVVLLHKRITTLLGKILVVALQVVIKNKAYCVSRRLFSITNYSPRALSALFLIYNSMSYTLLTQPKD